ncbi:unnamed protein product [Didymodactylos carnosus]|uniref:F-box domain-containing protein n=1 Tax=Didymodactylos carnosus TaxID=1234261 RepID=A0A815R4G4_9BILA|nr:unnamed protein product [Didymodactylos carnosus]CAF1472421.1 unnamed protein product [Didymodactylos carnosus]CAF3674410.1 unnamed protein product [Didymodactylos carnosus]CAF4339662.1 unnamed protein product [Didymodactylos carnosus]
MTKFVHLSNDIYLHLFKYFELADIFSIFYDINININSVINENLVSYDLSIVSRQKFNYYIRHLSSNPQYIYSLTISNEFHNDLIQLCLNQFEIKNCTHLHSLTINEPTFIQSKTIIRNLPYLKQLAYLSIYSKKYDDYDDEKLLDCVNLILNSRNYSLKHIIVPYIGSMDNIFTTAIVEDLTIGLYNLDQLRKLFYHIPHIKRLNVTIVKHRNSFWTDQDLLLIPESNLWTVPDLIYLKLTVENNKSITFEQIDFLLKRLPSLEHFLFGCHDQKLINGKQWEQILSSLVSLTNFDFYCRFPLENDNYDIKKLLFSFETKFCVEFNCLRLPCNSVIIFTKSYPQSHLEITWNQLQKDLTQENSNAPLLLDAFQLNINSISPSLEYYKFQYYLCQTISTSNVKQLYLYCSNTCKISKIFLLNLLSMYNIQTLTLSLPQLMTTVFTSARTHSRCYINSVHYLTWKHKHPITEHNIHDFLASFQNVKSVTLHLEKLNNVQFNIAKLLSEKPHIIFFNIHWNYENDWNLWLENQLHFDQLFYEKTNNSICIWT